MPSSSRRSSSRSRICAWIVTSSAVVGSSAISSRGRQASAIAIITRCRCPPRKLVRIVVAAGCAADGMPTRSSISTARSRCGARPMSLMRAQGLGDLLADGEHRIERGHRLLEHHRDAGAADALHARVRRGASGPAPSNRTLPAGDARRRLRQQAHDGQRGDALAAAGFADDAEDLARREVEADTPRSRSPRRARSRNATVRPRSRAGSLLHSQPRIEHVAQAVAEQIEAQHGRPSAATPGMVMIQGASRMYCRPSAMMLPQVGVGGTAPRPRKLSVASASTA